MPRSKHTALEKLAILKELSQSETSLNSFAHHHGIDRRTLGRWQDRYIRDGIDGLKTASKNNHYSKELKLTVVHAYLAGEGTYEQLTNRFGLRNSAQAKNWVDKYNGGKTLTASPSRKKVPNMSRKTTLEERIEIVEYVTQGKHKYTETAEHFQVSYQQVRSWVLKARDGGYEALVDNRGHRKEQAELTENDKLKLEIRQLKAQLKDKELVEAFAKKLLELQRRG
jgi:transposase-like protein